jgi:hypothetical protein
MFDAKHPRRGTLDRLARAVGIDPLRLHAELNELTDSDHKEAISRVMSLARFEVGAAAAELFLQAFRSAELDAKNAAARDFVRVLPETDDTQITSEMLAEACAEAAAAGRARVAGTGKDAPSLAASQEDPTTTALRAFARALGDHGKPLQSFFREEEVSGDFSVRLILLGYRQLGFTDKEFAPICAAVSRRGERSRRADHRDHRRAHPPNPPHSGGRGRGAAEEDLAPLAAPRPRLARPSARRAGGHHPGHPGPCLTEHHGRLPELGADGWFEPLLTILTRGVRPSQLGGGQTRRGRSTPAARTPKTLTNCKAVCGKDSSVVEGEITGQLAVGVRLGDEIVCLLLNGRHSVGAGHEAQRRFTLACKLDERVCELCRVTTLLPVHAVQDRDGLLGARGVVVDRGFGVARPT